MLIVTRLLAATAAKDDAAFNKVAGGLVIMLAPDFGAPVSRAEFAASLENCTAIQVVSSEPFPKMPEMQSVRITMQCRNKAGSQSVTVMADVMADNEHAVAVFSWWCVENMAHTQRISCRQRGVIAPFP